MEFPSLYVSAGFRRFLQENLATPFSERYEPESD